MDGNDKASDALAFVFDTFGTTDKVTLSRSDLRGLADEPNLARLVMATVVWGYTRGMRGNHVKNLINDLDALTQLLSQARAAPITDWKKHYLNVKTIGGVGPSTYTKFLNFLSVKVHGHSALILDDRIIQVASQGNWKELAPLRRLSNSNAVDLYPNYLVEMHSVANSLEVSPEALEFFLFEFGLNLKPLSGP